MKRRKSFRKNSKKTFKKKKKGGKRIRKYSIDRGGIRL